jgi:hypothetical protein
MMITQIHCHTCGGRIADPTIVSYRPADGALLAAVRRPGLCNCEPAIVYGPPAGYLSSPGLPLGRPIIPASRT